ncbi:MAG: SRPBCC family protein [Myxococcota bacterium]|nr:SRPBCC family protein [Myxococcota bacterium]
MSVGVLFLAMITSLPVISSTSAFSRDELKRIEQGDILVDRGTPKDGEGVTARMVALIDAPVSKVAPAVHECEHFSKFVPRTIKSEKRSQSGNHRLCYVEIDAPFPLSNLWALTDAYSRSFDDGRFLRKWYLREGTFKKNTGYWSLLPHGDKSNKTIAIYWVETKPDISVPDFIIRSAQASSLPKLIKAIRKRVAR